jgi:hypothetical protein
MGIGPNNRPLAVGSGSKSASPAGNSSALQRLLAIEDRIFTERRLRFYGTGVVVGLAIAAILCWASYRGASVIRPDGKLGSIDFCLLWISGKFAATNDPFRIYDYPTFSAAYDFFYPPGECRPLLQAYIYPPTYLFFTYVVGVMPYLVAFAVWVGATFLLYLAAVYSILPTPAAVIAAMASAAVLKNAQLGYNGFLTAGLFGLTLVCLERRPWLAGIPLGLLTYKPQFGVLFPLALLASRNWRALASAAATGVAFAMAAAIAFGSRTWPAFAASLAHLNSSLSPRAGVEISLDSVYGLLRWAGAGTGLAWAVHFGVALSLAAAVYAAWARPIPYALKAATLCLGSVLVTPYVLRYDLCILSIAVAFMVKDGLAHGFPAGERTIMLICLILLYCPLAPVGPIVCLLLLLLVFRRIARISGELPAGPRPATLGGAAA